MFMPPSAFLPSFSTWLYDKSLSASHAHTPTWLVRLLDVILVPPCVSYTAVM